MAQTPRISTLCDCKTSPINNKREIKALRKVENLYEGMACFKYDKKEDLESNNVSCTSNRKKNELSSQLIAVREKLSL